MLTHLHPNPKPPVRAVVLGAGGFIGGRILAALEQEMPTLALGRPALDLTSPGAGERLAAELRGDDVMVFASAKAPVRNAEMLLENLSMLQAVIAALHARPVGHVIYVSSDAVYRDSSAPLTEHSCAEPASLHGVMHLAREVGLRQEFPGPLTFVRPTLVYGILDPHNGYGPNRFRGCAARGEDIQLFGNGEERRDHVFVEDVAELVKRIVLHRSVGIANAVSGEVVSFREVAEFVAAAFTPKVAIKSNPRSGPMPHNGYRAFDNSAVLAALPGFRFTPWKDGLAQVHRATRTGATE